MNIRNLEYFIKVVDTNSFTKAAEELFISQSAISQQIKALEDELGFPLMIRNRKGFELTQAGKYLYIEGKNIIANIKEIEKHATYISKNNNKELKIGHVVNYGYQELKKALRIFSAKYPEIKISIKDGTHDTISANNINDVTDGDQRKAFSDRLNNVYIGDLYYSIKISNANNLSTKKALTINDLKDQNCIVIASREEFAKEIEFMKTKLGFDGDCIYATTLTEANLMVAANIGFLPVASKQKEKIDDGSIATIPLLKNNTILKSELYGFYKKLSDEFTCQKLIEIIKDVME
ncbi:MAG: LysR family transcriptional regulator [[Clostridium] spiroforme]|uniref:LysR family transcriptional regulator n=1 Tax=Thomasclavelia spiroformis TaxID=29348 RepID=UPI001DFCF08A|nr:LysR family transcriptional regulator [Thomasclavelia spiroformis]MBS7216682.1 LysR family transcriptional regulator [Thomasclavelia spiroformis]